MASRLRLRPDLSPLRRGRDAVQLGLSATTGGVVVEGLTPPEVALIERLDGPIGGALRPPELYAAAAELGVAAPRATELVRLLRAHGVLVDAPSPDATSPETGAGAGAGTREGTGEGTAPRSVPASGPWVVVDGRGELAGAVAGLLRASGAGRVDTGPWAADVADAELRELAAGTVHRPVAHRTGRPRVALVVVVTRGALDPAAGEPWRARRVPLLPVLDDGGRVLVGPLVTADPALPCLRCLRLARVDRDAHWPEVMAQASVPGQEPGSGTNARPDVLSVAAGVVAMVARTALVPVSATSASGPNGGAEGAATRPGRGVSVEVTGPWPRLDHRRWTRHPACPAHDPTPSDEALDGSGVEPPPARVTMTG